MKAFVATRATQGMRPSDSSTCVLGELLWMIEPCPDSRGRVDGPCNCGRSFHGLNSDRTTTTAVVRDLPDFTRADYEKALEACFDAQGWCPCCRVRTVPEFIDELLTLAAALPIGAVVERRLDQVRVRTTLKT